MEKLQLSTRSYDQILKVARTNMDLAGNKEVDMEHLAKSIQLRFFIGKR